MSQALFTPTTLGKLQLQNRVVMAPLTRCRAIGNVPNELMEKYYSLRAEAGLIIAEGTSPSPNGLGYARMPGLFSDEQIQGWKRVTDRVHAAGGKIEQPPPSPSTCRRCGPACRLFMRPNVKLRGAPKARPSDRRERT
ncbi:oxidoreductase [Gallionella capsiferriformans]|uniref:NADH:flavin oxidoreductase/NADH oxidase n=1 Tax=Gallionella capsiferriformans (strain ES-2) TaxID=395494 RepID=D9SG64_GALCS|nr:NADH:flavin oxidoreductase [Gallionella capsiferriformans]ADL55511.1 NADH:flavin oxidoreductase/NADH oxidase [Gallionella capsiferriformans ES-2]